MGTLKFITVFTKKCSKPEQIRSVNDCRRVKRWIAKTVVMYVVFSIIAAIISIAIASIPSYPDFIELPTTMAYILVPLVTVLTCWGFATLIMYLPQVIGSVGTAAAKGYEIGESIQTTHVTATHEYGNTYRVSSYTENQGCLFLVFGGLIGFLIWAVFCVYIGPFINFKKIIVSSKNIKNFSRNKQRYYF